MEMSQEESDMREKLKNMSPEQLKEYQKQNCIFCQIISGKVQSKKIYEDSRCIAILDINPANPGHILLMPKEHFSVMPQIPEPDIGHLFMVSKALSSEILKSLKVKGTNIFVANGAAAGQRAQHFMIHIIPRKDNDGITAFNIPQRQIPDSDLDEIKARMVGVIAKVFGLRAPATEEKKDKTEEKAGGKTKKEKNPENRQAKERLVSKNKIAKDLDDKEILKSEKIDLDKIAGLFK